MNRDSALHDTYYLVSHFQHILTIAVISVAVLACSAGVRRWSESQLSQVLRRLAVACWALGLALSVAVIVGWQLVKVQTFIEKPFLLSLMNDASIVAGFILVLALVMCLAMNLVALWHKAFIEKR